MRPVGEVAGKAELIYTPEHHSQKLATRESVQPVCSKWYGLRTLVLCRRQSSPAVQYFAAQ